METNLIIEERRPTPQGLQGAGEARSGDRAHRLSLQGDLTIYTAAELKQKLLPWLAAHDELELELAKVAEIDTAGFQVLLLLKREALSAGKELRIVSHSQSVLDLLDLYNMAAYFGDPLLITQEEADASKRRGRLKAD